MKKDHTEVSDVSIHREKVLDQYILSKDLQAKEPYSSFINEPENEKYHLSRLMGCGRI